MYLPLFEYVALTISVTRLLFSETLSQSLSITFYLIHTPLSGPHSIPVLNFFAFWTKKEICYSLSSPFYLGHVKDLWTPPPVFFWDDTG